MNVLLDTHALLWFLEDDPRLSSRARAVLAQRGNAARFSVASYWEMCIKLSLGKLRLARDWETTMESAMREAGITWLPIEPAHARAVIALPFHHRDPFDRLLVAQASCEQLTLLSADPSLSLYPVPVVW